MRHVSKRAETEYYVCVYEFDKDRQFAYIVAGNAGIIALGILSTVLLQQCKTKGTTNYTELIQN